MYKFFLIQFVFLFSFLNFLHAQETVIKGKLLGYDNKPMKAANVSVRNINSTKVFHTEEVLANGEYTISIDKHGFLYLIFSGVDHEPVQIPFLNDDDKNLEINVSLKLNEYEKDFSDLAVIGDFNNFSFSAPLEMIKNKNGTYSVNIDYSGDSVRYQFIGLVEGRSVNGIESIGFEFDRESDYCSIILTKNNKAKITLDPKKLIRKKSEEKILLDEQIKFDREILKRYIIDERLKDDRDKKYSAFVTQGNFPDDFIFDWTPYKNELENLISNTENKRYKKFLILLYTNLQQYNVVGIDSTLFTYLLTEIPYNSYLWSMKNYVLTKAISYLSEEDRITYVEKVLSESSDENTKLILIVNEFIEAKLKNNEPLQRLYFDKLKNQYKNSPVTEIIENQFNPDRKIKEGVEVPSFNTISLFDSTKTYTKENLLGSVYLIDFWAVWCKPCMAERRYLYDAFEKFQSNGLNIISISFDKKEEDAKKHIINSKQNSWINVFIPDGFNSSLTKDFEIVVIPKPFLVNQQGKIIAIEEQLRGKALEQTLYKFLGNN
ncbi:MAG: thioredoxin-like domain-containing protein [Ignavibacteria bacterium]|nr:thioredoxin-like domain-containing protein [Ignavibacteria bacterium]